MLTEPIVARLDHCRSELPFFRRSVIPRALTWKRLQQPSSRASTLLTGLFSVPLTRITSVPECAGSSMGFLWGSSTVAELWGFCGAGQRPSTCLADRHGAQYSNLWVVVTSRITAATHHECALGGAAAQLCPDRRGPSGRLTAGALLAGRVLIGPAAA